MDRIKRILHSHWLIIVAVIVAGAALFSCAVSAQVVQRPSIYHCIPIGDLTPLLGVRNPKMVPLMIDEDGDEWAVGTNPDTGVTAPGFIDRDAGLFCVPTRGKVIGRSA